MSINYINIKDPKIYYYNLDLLGGLFRKYGGNPIYYISEYREKIRYISNKNIKIQKKIFEDIDCIVELLTIIDNLFLENI